MIVTYAAPYLSLNVNKSINHPFIVSSLLFYSTCISSLDPLPVRFSPYFQFLTFIFGNLPVSYCFAFLSQTQSSTGSS